MSGTQRRGRSRVVVIILVLAAAGWAGFDLLGPRRTDIRRFDADRVARLDTDMWRSYYDRKPFALFLQLAQLMREQFHFPWLRSHVAAFRAARAAFVFKRGRNRDDYRRALPDLERYYGSIRAISTTPFDVRRTSELELEWWIVHRERLRRGEGDLERALADAAAEFYRVPVSAMVPYAHERAVAMAIRDTNAARGVSEQDWKAIEERLRTSWGSLASAVNR